VLVPVSHRQGFGEAFRFVVAGTLTDGVNMPPVTFWLRVHFGVAVNFRSGRQQKFRPMRLRQTQHVISAQRPNFQGVDGMSAVIFRAGRAGKMQDPIHSLGDEKGMSDVVLDESEAGMGLQVGDVLRPPREQTVQANHFVPFSDEAVTKVRAQKACTARDEHPHHASSFVSGRQMHNASRFH
jgi:hypothetical protein